MTATLQPTNDRSGVPETLPSAMRAATLRAYGPAETLQVERVPAPLLRHDDVLIRVHASSLNPIDAKIRQGTQRVVIPLKFPTILGRDVSGEVIAVGPSVTAFVPGDAVFAIVDHRRPGAHAEYVAVTAKHVAHRPTSCTHEEAAALPLVGLTAWQALFEAGRLEAGQRILIQAGAGGVGTIAIQLAKWRGAHVITTCSPRNEALVRGLGADEVIDYRTTHFTEVCEDLDVLLDAIGGASRWDGIRALRRGGRHVSIVSDLPANVEAHGALPGTARAFWNIARFTASSFAQKRIISKMTVMRTDGGQLAELARLVDEGVLRPVLDSTFALDEIAAAHRHIEGKHARGKIIITP